MQILRRIFYGWYVVLAVALVLTTASGLGFYNLSVLLDAFVRERGFPVALASGATACYFVGSGCGGVLAGVLLERFDPRAVIITSAALSALALASLGLLHDPWQVYLFHLLFGFCYGCGGTIPNITVVARWFEARRSLALSIASTGLSLGGIVITPFSAYLIEHRGLAAAAPWLGLGLVVGMVPLTALVVRPSPLAMGLEPDGGFVPAQGSVAKTAPRAMGFGDAWRGRFFLGVTVAYFFALGAQVGAIAHLYRLAKTGGDVEIAALAVALLAGASVTGRLVGGWILLKISARTFTLATIGLQAAALAVLALSTGRATLLAGVVMFGLAMGNVLMMQPLLLAEAFGTRSFGRLYSLSQFATMPGVAGGPALVGAIFQITGGYEIPYLVAAGASLLGIVIILAARSPRSDR